MSNPIRWLTIVLLSSACTAETPVEVDQVAEGWTQALPVDDPAYQAARRRYDDRIRRRNAELVQKLDIAPEAARAVEDSLNTEHAARLAMADQADSTDARRVGRGATGAEIRALIGKQNAERLERLQETAGSRRPNAPR